MKGRRGGKVDEEGERERRKLEKKYKQAKGRVSGPPLEWPWVGSESGQRWVRVRVKYKNIK
jgi:hypothetical protein